MKGLVRDDDRMFNQVARDVRSIAAAIR